MFYKEHESICFFFRMTILSFIDDVLLNAEINNPVVKVQICNEENNNMVLLALRLFRT